MEKSITKMEKKRSLQSFADMLVVLTIIWACVTYFSIRPHGVTAVDPYGYVQMAVDLVEHGTATHKHDFSVTAAQWGFALYPTVPVAYTVPNPLTGISGTPWAPGHSILLAIGYWFFGEVGLYIITPIIGLLSLVVMRQLSVTSLSSYTQEKRLMVAGIAVFVLATSYEQIDRMAVAMADTSSQFFSMLTIYFAWRYAHSTRSRGVWPYALTYPCAHTLAFISGASLGLAFAMRYTQVLMGFSALFLLLSRHVTIRPNSDSKSIRACDHPLHLIRDLIAFSLGAGLMALPVFWYHQQAFGNPFTTGSYELTKFALVHIPSILMKMWHDFLAPKEFLFIAPFIIIGIIHLWTTDKKSSIALFLWFIAIVGFHLPYSGFSLRELLSVFPILALYSGIGVVYLLTSIPMLLNKGVQINKGVQKINPLHVQIICLILIALIFLWRSNYVLTIATHPGFTTYGYLNTEHRQAFEQIEALTPPTALIGASLNGGAVQLYANRTIIRPAYWTVPEWLRFVDLAFNDGYPLYMLMDGSEMGQPFEAIQNDYQLVEVGILPMTYFIAGSGYNQDVVLYQVLR